MYDFKGKIKQLFELNEESKNVKKKLDPLKKEFKGAMNKEKTDKIEEDGIVASISTQERKSMNEDLLVEKLKEQGLTEAVKVVEVPNEEVIEELIVEGKLDPSLLDECLIVKHVQVLNVKKQKKQGGNKVEETPVKKVTKKETF